MFTCLSLPGQSINFSLVIQTNKSDRDKGAVMTSVMIEVVTIMVVYVSMHIVIIIHDQMPP